MRFILGLVGGFALAVLVGDEFLGDATLGITLLAFVGGFSADVVYRILERIVETIEALIRGSSQARLEDQERSIRDQATADVAEGRIRLARQLVSLESELESLEKPQVRERLVKLIEAILPFERDDPEEPGQPPSTTPPPDVDPAE